MPNSLLRDGGARSQAHKLHRLHLAMSIPHPARYRARPTPLGSVNYHHPKRRGIPCAAPSMRSIHSDVRHRPEPCVFPFSESRDADIKKEMIFIENFWSDVFSRTKGGEMTKKEPSKEKIREGKDEGGGQGKKKVFVSCFQYPNSPGARTQGKSST